MLIKTQEAGMRVTIKERQKITAALAGRHQKARKKEKVILLNEFIALTGYSRSLAIRLRPLPS